MPNSFIKKTRLYKNYFLLIILFFFSSIHTYAQLCEGSLGDAIASIDFGSGSTTGDALDAGITAFTYSNSGELDEGEYTIANSTSGLKGDAWHVTTDHTGDANGYMMVINSAVLADEGVFYTKTVSGLCGYTTYEFSAWLMNVMNPSAGTDEYHPDVTFRISDTSGTILGSYNTGDIAQTTTGTWVQYGFYFTLDNETEVVITMLNDAPSAHPGNDIVLDDITFRPCGPTIINSIENEASTNIIVCQDETVSYNFQTEISSGYSDPQYQWQVSDDYGITWNDISGATTSDYNFTDTSIPGDFLYRVSVANGANINSVSCRISSDDYYVQVLEKPEALIGETEQYFCTTQNPTLATIEVSATAIWYDALIGGNILDITTSLVDGTTYYAAQETSNGCESDDRLAVLVHIVAPSLVVNNVSTEICDTSNDAEETINLITYETDITTCSDCFYSYFTSQTDAENYVEANQITTPTYYNFDGSVPTIYVRVDSNDKCYQIATITLSLVASPTIDLADTIGVCEGETAVTIDAGSGFDSYLWSTGETTQTITVNAENIGDYSVTVTEDHTTYICSSTKEFEVISSNIAVVATIDVKDWTDDDNTIQIYLSDSSLGDYEYSLDNSTYQDSAIFSELTPGAYTVYINDKNGCGVTGVEVYLLTYPKFFTPNNDGYNDTWSIEYSDTEPTMTTKIFDRYGKFLKILDATSSWDGTYNGRNMPASDYWFMVTRANGKNYTGHFSLKR